MKIRSRILKLLLRKELTDVFRDKKAIVMMVIVPVLLYPLIFFGTLAVMTMVQSRMEQGEYRVVVETEDGGSLREAIDAYNEKQKKKNSEDLLTVVTAEEAGLSRTETQSFHPSEDAIKDALQEEKIAAFVTSKKISSGQSSGKIQYQVYYLSSVTNSQYASGILEDVLTELKESETEENLRKAGLDAETIMNPLETEEKDLSTSEQSAGSVLGTILPFLLVLSLLMGTMYPAIDTTAGEKERGTLETLLTLPVSNQEIILSKFLTVALVGIISAFLNILSIGFLGFYMLNLMRDTLREQMGISLDDFHGSQFVPAAIFTVLAIFAFSLFISAVTMCITALAKSYKEANNYITPLTLVVLLTGYIGFIPNVRFTNQMALIPVANICLMIKNLLMFRVNRMAIAITLLSNVLYAFLAVMLLSRMYNSESVLFDEGRFSVQLFQRRKNMKKGGVPTPGDGWFLILLVMAVYLYLGSMLQLKYGIGGVFGIQLIILLIPLLYVIYTRKDIRKTYRFRKTSPLSFVAAVFLIAGVMLIGVIVTSLVSMIFPAEAESVSTDLMSILKTDHEMLTLLVVAVSPAVAEEMMFRGFLLSAFRSRYRTVTSILIVSVIFGIYHLSIVRFFTTAILGGALAAAVYYTDSIYPAMLMHFLNNGLAVIQMYHPDLFERYFPLLATEEPTILSAIVMSAMGIILTAGGISIFLLIKQKQTGTAPRKA